MDREFELIKNLNDLTEIVNKLMIRIETLEKQMKNHINSVDEAHKI